jgi:hypothetical protein
MMTNPMHPIRFFASVELGSPEADCAHFGICSVELISSNQWAEFHPLNNRQVRAVLSKTREGLLRFEFSLKGMRTDTRTQFFSAEGFRIDSACVLPDSITIKLGFKSGISTIPGVYALKYLKSGIVVKLSTTQNEVQLDIHDFGNFPSLHIPYLPKK